MIRVGVLLVRVLLVRALIPRVLRIVILRVREEYLENTLRARTRAYALVDPLATLDDHGLPPHPGLAYAYGRIMHARTRRRLLSKRKNNIYTV